MNKGFAFCTVCKQREITTVLYGWELNHCFWEVHFYALTFSKKVGTTCLRTLFRNDKYCFAFAATSGDFTDIVPSTHSEATASVAKITFLMVIPPAFCFLY